MLQGCCWYLVKNCLLQPVDCLAETIENAWTVTSGSHLKWSDQRILLLSTRIYILPGLYTFIICIIICSSSWLHAAATTKTCRPINAHQTVRKTKGKTSFVYKSSIYIPILSVPCIQSCYKCDYSPIIESVVMSSNHKLPVVSFDLNDLKLRIYQCSGNAETEREANPAWKNIFIIAHI